MSKNFWEKKSFLVLFPKKSLQSKKVGTMHHELAKCHFHLGCELFALNVYDGVPSPGEHKHKQTLSPCPLEFIVWTENDVCE